MSTADTLLDLAEHHLLHGGWHAFSYADLADGVGIRKPSVHHHFPTKSDLGVALVRRLRHRLENAAAALDEHPPATRVGAVERAYAQMARDGRVGVLAVLASELPGLPAAVQAEVRGLVGFQVGWLQGAVGSRSDALDLLGRLEGRALLQRSLPLDR